MEDIATKPQEEAKSDRASRRAKKEFTIIYVDDEAPNLRGFKSAFRRYFNVLTAIGPEEAIQVIKSEKIDLVVTDHRMPYMAGTELLKEVYDFNPDIKRMILSGFIKRNELDDAVGSFGIHEFVTKPWDFDNLMEIFNTLLTTNPDTKTFGSSS
ncbi:MAG: response regulator [Cyclobacteriaceae bacterium]|nr:response regulator [Cyclobacteriaceae bacterium HetDA_MAG_MS6]